MNFVSGQYNSALASDKDKQARNNTVGSKGNCGVHGGIGRQIIWSKPRITAPLNNHFIYKLYLCIKLLEKLSYVIPNCVDYSDTPTVDKYR